MHTTFPSRKQTGMSSVRRPLFFAIALLFFMICLPTSAEAKRVAPTPVRPVTIGLIAYSAPHTHGRVVVATDTHSKKELWRQRIYPVFINPFKERDVQEVYIVSLIQRGGHALTITNESGRRFTLNLNTRKVTKVND